jgi:hypothetical protein
MTTRFVWAMLALTLVAHESAGRFASHDSKDGDGKDAAAVFLDEATAVRELTKLGAQIGRDVHRKGRPVVWVNLSAQVQRKPVTDACLMHLAVFPQLEGLELCSANITDEGLRRLASFPNLKCLDLTSTDITDAGLSHLVKLRHLKYLATGGSKVTEAGLLELWKVMPYLEINNKEERQTGVVPGPGGAP